MNHQKVIQTLVHKVCAEGVLPSEVIQRHIASCRSCLDTLALVTELVKPGSSRSWYESVKGHFLCDEVESELDLIAAKDADALAAESPAIAAHLRECGLCAERYVSTQRLLEAESEGVLGHVISLPERKSVLWTEVKEKVFELTQAIGVTISADSTGFQPLGPSGLPNLLVAPLPGALRSWSPSEDDAVAVPEARIELSPPTISDELTVRLLYESEGLVTIEFGGDSGSLERLVIALFAAGEKASLLEARSLSSAQPVVRFERLPIDDYMIEIRGPSGVSRVPLSLRREGE